MERRRDLGTGPTFFQPFLLAILAMAGALCCAPARAQEASEPPRLLIELPILVNGLDAGVAPVDMSQPGALEISLTTLRRALSDAVSEEALQGLDDEIARRRGESGRIGRALSRIGPRAEDSSVVGSILGEAGLEPEDALPPRQDYVPIADLAALTGLPIRFDNRSAAVSVTLPADQLRALSISLRRNDLESRQPDPPAGRSAFLNVRLSSAYVHESEFGLTGRAPSRLDLNGAARPFGPRGPALVGSGFWLEDAVVNEWRRGDVYLIADNRETLFRAELGDVRFLPAPFQGGVPLLGLSVSREYDDLAPARLVQPGGRYVFILERTSLVQVFLNGALLRTLRLRAGRYDVRDFAFFDGANDIEIRIEDDSGRIERLSFTAFSDKALLAPGLSEFGYAVGFPFQRVGGRTEYDFERLNASFQHRFGLTDRVTAALDGQSDGDVHQLGGGFVFAGLGGALEAHGAASRSETGSWDGALEAAYEIRLEQLIGLEELRFDIAGDYIGQGFARLGEPLAVNEIAGSASARLSAPLPGRIYASAGGRYEFGRAGRPDSWGVNATLSRPLGPVTALISLTADRAFDEDDTRLGAFFSLSARLGRGRFVRTRYDSLTRATVAELIQPARPRPGSLGWTAAYETRPGASAVTGEAGYVGNRFEAEVRHELNYSGPDSDLTEQRSRASFAFAIAAANGRWAVGRPVGESFAIIGRHSNLGDRALRLEGPGGEARARAGALGPALLPDLSSYRTRLIEYDIDDLPPGYDLGRGEFEVFPPVFSGYAFTVGSDAATTAMGAIRLPTGEPVALAGALVAPVVPDERTGPVQIFTNRSGRFVAAGLRAGRWRVVIRLDQPYAAEFTVPEDAAGLVQAGTLTLQPYAEVRS